VPDLQEEIGGIHPLDPLGVQFSTPVHLHHPLFEIKEKNSESLNCLQQYKFIAFTIRFHLHFINIVNIYETYKAQTPGI
jgi:hypothetical protein